MKEFKFLRNNSVLFGGMEIVRVSPCSYNPDSFEPTRVVIFKDEYGTNYMDTISRTHPQWNEIMRCYPPFHDYTSFNTTR